MAGHDDEWQHSGVASGGDIDSLNSPRKAWGPVAQHNRRARSAVLRDVLPSYSQVLL